ncbi:hypothetical protein SAMN05216490_2697 [Mucilaginibacter mallensis]|uniref:Uncharacterized protein n=1 Tax=Mucilaginibacter mallensis TaxID=652787 RepID=A0A1H1YCV7_MUCMA|nr:hypothetical protein [Mucilaginibacter mallensis]SDT19224.1 hypothetical protein SAMN05216490_2697 [Mucilaginibacter mallensis]
MLRKLLHVSEDKVSYLQIIGFSTILLCLLYMFYEQIFGTITGANIAIVFFTIMLGFSFAFPELLRDSNKGISTMRIAVFMMINVICMLLLKIGWEKHDLKAIGLDEYWMGVIAFVFGAKATQSYFESKLAAVSSTLQSTQMTTTTLTPPPISAPVTTTTSTMSSPITSIATPPVSTIYNDENLDGCGIQSTTLTGNADLPASEGGMQ